MMSVGQVICFTTGVRIVIEPLPEPFGRTGSMKGVLPILLAPARRDAFSAIFRIPASTSPGLFRMNDAYCSRVILRGTLGPQTSSTPPFAIQAARRFSNAAARGARWPPKLTPSNATRPASTSGRARIWSTTAEMTRSQSGRNGRFCLRITLPWPGPSMARQCQPRRTVACAHGRRPSMVPSNPVWTISAGPRLGPAG